MSVVAGAKEQTAESMAVAEQYSNLITECLNAQPNARYEQSMLGFPQGCWAEYLDGPPCAHNHKYKCAVGLRGRYIEYSNLPAAEM